MCGEHHGRILVKLRELGSSPHVRGAHGLSGVGQTRVGIIPACAGSTSEYPDVSVMPRDHPRMCGEHLKAVVREQGLPGSSPHVRGALALEVAAQGVPGIIPACAGSTAYAGIGSAGIGDHPRMCGEHLFGVLDVALGLGSSPHVRGAHDKNSADASGQGIIPACAGSTLRK